MQLEVPRWTSILFYLLGRVDVLNHYLRLYGLNEKLSRYVGILALVTSALKPQMSLRLQYPIESSHHPLPIAFLHSPESLSPY